MNCQLSSSLIACILVIFLCQYFFPHYHKPVLTQVHLSCKFIKYVKPLEWNVSSQPCSDVPPAWTPNTCLTWWQAQIVRCCENRSEWLSHSFNIHFFCISHIYLTATAFYFSHKHSYFCMTNCCFMLSLLCTDGFYVTWAASEGAVMAPGQSLPPHGKQLGCLDSADLKEIIQKVHSKEPRSQAWRKYLLYHFSCALLSCRAWHCTAVITGSWISSSSGRCMTLCPAWIGS